MQLDIAEFKQIKTLWLHLLCKYTAIMHIQQIFGPIFNIIGNIKVIFTNYVDIFTNMWNLSFEYSTDITPTLCTNKQITVLFKRLGSRHIQNEIKLC